MGDDRHLAVVPLLLVARKPPDEPLVRGERALDERRVHPELELGVGRRVARSAREAAELVLGLAADVLVHGLDRLTGAIGLVLRSVRDQVERAERANEPAPEVAAEVGVLDDARRDERMRDLEEHGRAAPQEGRQRGVADAPDRALGREVAVPAREPFGVLPRGGCSRAAPHPYTVPESSWRRPLELPQT